MNSLIDFLDRLDKTVYEYLLIYADPPWLVDLCHILVKSYLLLPFLFIFFFFYYRFAPGKPDVKKITYAVLYTLILLAISENIASLFKFLFERHRPVYQMGIYISEGGYSFPSAHALNTMAFAAFWSSRFRQSSGYIYSVSVIIGLARMMANYHFPGDILGGWVLGYLTGKVFSMLVYRIEGQRNPQRESDKHA